MRSLSLIGFIVSNMLPIFAVFYFDWKPFDLVLIYWAESLILGFYTVLKMLYVDTPNVRSDIAVFSEIPTFAGAYSIFCIIIGIAILRIFNQFPVLSGDEFFPKLAFVTHLFKLCFVERKWVCLSIFLGYGVSFVCDYMKGQQYFRAYLGKLMVLPMLRCIALAVLFYYALCVTGSLQSSMASAKIICLKIGFDVFFGFLERRRAVL